MLILNLKNILFYTGNIVRKLTKGGPVNVFTEKRKFISNKFIVNWL